MPLIHFIADTHRGGYTSFIDGIPAYGESETRAEAANDLMTALRWLSGLVAERFPTTPLSTDLQQAWSFVDRILDAAAAGRSTVFGTPVSTATTEFRWELMRLPLVSNCRTLAIMLSPWYRSWNIGWAAMQRWMAASPHPSQFSFILSTHAVGTKRTSFVVNHGLSIAEITWKGMARSMSGNPSEHRFPCPRCASSNQRITTLKYIHQHRAAAKQYQTELVHVSTEAACVCKDCGHAWTTTAPAR